MDVKHLRVTLRFDAEQAPTFFNALANSDAIDEARVLDVNTTLEGVDNYMFAIEGDPTPFAERATETPGVESVELSGTEAGLTYALVVVRSVETPVYDSILRMSSQDELVIRTPFVYRDGNVYGRAVGDPEALQRALADPPDAVDVQVDEVGEFRARVEDPARTLSDRQREALSVALALGYYDQPRGATHEDVAAELGCAPPTASEHLQKAEAKVIRAVMDRFDPDP